MNSSFIVFSAECVNQCQDSVCRLAFTPVVNGDLQPPRVFYINPESFWEATSREIDKDFCLQSPTIKEIWPEVENLLKKFPTVVSVADGYSARVLWYHLKRVAAEFKRIEYFNAKGLCRKFFPEEFSYSYDLLASKHFPQYIESGDAETATNGWAALIAKGLAESGSDSLDSFARENKVIPGVIDMMKFVPSVSKRIYSGPHTHKKVDFSDVDIKADENHPFFEKEVVFTGKLERMTRAEARKLVVSVGGDAPENLTSSTNYLVVGVQDLRVVGEKGLSGKMKKAAVFKEKGKDIELIDENDFFEMINYK